jgi:uncharacterized protein (TIGR02147 family)
MNIYSEDNYRIILKKIIEEQKALKTSMSFQSLAEHTRIPKSYFSKVIHDQADLSQDQLYLVCRELKLSPEEQDYLSLLLEFARTSVEDRKKLLKRKISKIQSKNLDTRKVLEKPGSGIAIVPNIQDYYLDPLRQIVHICLSIPKYRHNPTLLAKDLNVSNERISGCIDKLEKLMLIERKDGELRLLHQDLHLPRDSEAYRPWKSQLRSLASSQMDRLHQDHFYSFSVVLSTSRKAGTKMHAELLETIGRLQKISSDSPLEQAFQINIDLFPWTE